MGSVEPGSRWRIVTTQGTKAHVSSVVLSEEEAREHLDLEAGIHEKFGWIVTRGADVVVARKRVAKGLLERVLTIRETDPFDDHVSD